MMVICRSNVGQSLQNRAKAGERPRAASAEKLSSWQINVWLFQVSLDMLHVTKLQQTKYGGFLEWGHPKMDDLGVPPF